MRDDSSLFLGFLVGAVGSVAIFGIVNDYRHKTQIHRRINSVAGRLARANARVDSIDGRVATLRKWASQVDDVLTMKDAINVSNEVERMERARNDGGSGGTQQADVRRTA